MAAASTMKDMRAARGVNGRCPAKPGLSRSRPLALGSDLTPPLPLGQEDAARYPAKIRHPVEHFRRPAGHKGLGNLQKNAQGEHGQAKVNPPLEGGSSNGTDPGDRP